MNKTQDNNKAFEQLLKQAFLEQKDDNLIEKTINMNANYIFSKDINTTIPEAKLEQLLSRHQISNHIISGSLQKLIYWIIPSVFLIGLAFLANNKFNKPNKQNFVPPIIVQRDTTSIEQLRAKGIKDLENTKISPELIANFPSSDEDEKEAENKTRKEKLHWKSTSGSGTFRKKHQINYPDLYEAPAPIFDAEASPGNYILKTTSLSKPRNNNLFALLKASCFVSYYEGQPFAKGMEDFVYVNEAERILKDKFNKQELYIPRSFKYHLNKYELNKESKFVVDTLTKQQLDLLLKPYYFSKYEVSIKEYREFAKWVWESNGYNNIENTKDQIKAKQNAYYMNWLKLKDKAFIYTFFKPSSEVLKALNGNTITISPLDTVHVNGRNSYMMDYEVNPFYSKWDLPNYPVMGVSYYQALAFLDWKTYYHQAQLDKKGVYLEVKYCLPTSLERRLVIEQSNLFDDKNNLCDLKVEQIKNNSLDQIINNNNSNQNTLGYLFPISDKKEELSESNYRDYTLANSVAYLGSNVSEWTKDSYQDNYANFLIAHQQQIKNSEAGALAVQIENFYNASNCKNGQLVMGGNYLDGRYGKFNMHYGKKDISFNKLGVYLKKYLDPHKQYESVGFRYIVKVKDSDEKNKEELLHLIGSFDYDKYNDFPEAYINDFHEVTHKDDIYILNKEITNGMWRAFLLDLLKNGDKEQAMLCLPQSELWSKYNKDYIYYFRDLKYDELPVVNISHEAANIFNKWLTDKYNIYALRKFGIVEFKLPNEAEWESAASGRQNAVKYAWGGPYARNFKGSQLANLKMLPYKNEGEYILKATNNSTSVNDKAIINDSIKIESFEQYLNGDISYTEFREKDDAYWLSKSKLLIYHKKDISKNKQQILNTNYSLFLTDYGFYNANEIGLFDIHGNVAEMIENPKKTKGGSWNSYAEFSTIKKYEAWDGEASPMVGFRPVMKILYRGYDHNIKVEGRKQPPGAILLNPNYGVDLREIRNVDYREYMYYTMSVYGRNSQKYLNVLPDTTVWDFNKRNIRENKSDTVVFENSTQVLDGIYDENGGALDINTPLTNQYFRHPAYRNYPVVGVSYEQAKAFCTWRSKVVNEIYDIYHARNPNKHTIPKKVTYRLPTAKEWESFSKIDSIYTDKGYVKKEVADNRKKKEKQNVSLTGPVNYGYPTAIGLYWIEGNLSEMTSVKGQAKGGNWAQKYFKQKGEDVKYSRAESWIGFRCVVDVEYY